MKKFISIVCALLVFTVVLCSCAQAVTFQTSGAGYEVVSVETGEQALGKTAGSGNKMCIRDRFVTVQFVFALTKPFSEAF